MELALGKLQRLCERLGTGLLSGFHFRKNAHLYTEQIYRAGVQSTWIVVFCLAFLSVLMVVELSIHMKLVLRQDSLVPAFSSVLMLRELGPVVACLLLTSRVGAAMGAEIGMMKNTEQLDALRVLGMDPVEYLVLPRWFAGVVASVCLSVFAVAVAILCGAGIASLELGISGQQYMQSMFLFVRGIDGATCLVKALVFGTIMPLVACREGFRCGPGSVGVGTAATSAVVRGAIGIIIADFAVSYFMQRL
ncbi:ABC transporter permease [bacterium]|nr:ABC transporter permease [bacterium]